MLIYLFANRFCWVAFVLIDWTQFFVFQEYSHITFRLLRLSKTFQNNPKLTVLSQEYEQRLAGLGVPVENASWRSATAEELTTIKETHSNEHNGHSNNEHNGHNGQQAELKKTEPAKRHPSSSNSPCTTGILLEGEDSPTTNSSPISSNGEQDEMET